MNRFSEIYAVVSTVAQDMIGFENGAFPELQKSAFSRDSKFFPKDYPRQYLLETRFAEAVKAQKEKRSFTDENEQVLNHFLLVLFTAIAESSKKWTKTRAVQVVKRLPAIESKLKKELQGSLKERRPTAYGYEIESEDPFCEWVLHICDRYKMLFLDEGFLVKYHDIRNAPDGHSRLKDRATIEPLLDSLPVSHKKFARKVLESFFDLFGEFQRGRDLDPTAALLQASHLRKIYWSRSFNSAEVSVGLENFFVPTHTIEARSFPSTSVRKKLREIALLWRSGIFSSKEPLNFHTTYSGVTLSPEEVEFMDVLHISAAAGFLPEAILKSLEENSQSLDEDFDERQPLSFAEPIVFENNMKSCQNPASETRSTFPFHLPKGTFDLDSVLQGKRRHSYKTAVERRGLFYYSPDEYAEFCYDSLLADAAARCVSAHQRPDNLCSLQDKKARVLWTELMNFWKGGSFFTRFDRAGVLQRAEPKLHKDSKKIINILELYDISGLNQKSDYYWTHYSEHPNADIVAELPYSLMLTELYLNSLDTQYLEFRKRVRARCFEFIAAVRDLYDLR